MVAMQRRPLTLPLFLTLLLPACGTNKVVVGLGKDAGGAGDASRSNLVSGATSLSFGSVRLGSKSAVHGFVVTNQASVASGAIALGSDNEEFTIHSGLVGSCVSGVTNLAPGASCLVSLVFAPSVSGSRTGTMTFSDSSGGKGTVSVAGEGTTSVTPGTLALFAGGIPSQQGSTDGAGTVARFYEPMAVAVDDAGNVFVADVENRTIRKVTPDGTVTTLAGTGQSGNADGIGSDAISYPKDLAVDRAGNLFVGDSNCTVRKIAPDGTITTFAKPPSAPCWYGIHIALDGMGNVFAVSNGYDKSEFWTVASDGVVTTSFSEAGRLRSLAVDRAGNLFTTDYYTIRKIAPDGTVTIVAGTPGQTGSADGPGAAARFNRPEDVTVDGEGNLFVADTENDTIRKITPDGTVTTLAGVVGRYGSADGIGSEARFKGPYGVAVDSAGNVYVADSFNNAIRKISPSGVVTTLAGTAGLDGVGDGRGTAARFENPEGVAMDWSGNLFVADTDNNTIRKITLDGTVTTLAGAPGQRGCTDGKGAVARFAAPTGVAVDRGGNLFVADSDNNIIRRITLDGTVTTFAGVAGQTGSADGTRAAARFAAPTGVAVDGVGNVFVADSGNHTIRKITPDGVVTTFAGKPGSSCLTDGAGADACFHRPYGVAVDGAGNLFVADIDDNKVRKITSGGVVTTLGKDGDPRGCTFDEDLACFQVPIGLAVDGAGNLFVADSIHDAIRRFTPDGTGSTLVGYGWGICGAMSTIPGALPATLRRPLGVVVDPLTGNLYITDHSAVLVAGPF